MTFKCDNLARVDIFNHSLLDIAQTGDFLWGTSSNLLLRDDDVLYHHKSLRFIENIVQTMKFHFKKDAHLANMLCI